MSDEKRLRRIQAKAAAASMKKLRKKLGGGKTPFQKDGIKASERALSRTRNKMRYDKYIHSPNKNIGP